jgi:hypothetical protein
MNETTTTRRTEPAAPRRRRGGLLRVVALLVVLAVIAIVLLLLNGGTNVSYNASITSLVPLSTSEVAVSVQVANTGSSSGTPACTINVKSPNGAYTGEGVVTASQALPKGAQTTLHDTITVTHQGAHSVTAAASSLSCV